LSVGDTTINAFKIHPIYLLANSNSVAVIDKVRKSGQVRGIISQKAYCITVYFYKRLLIGVEKEFDNVSFCRNYDYCRVTRAAFTTSGLYYALHKNEYSAFGELQENFVVGRSRARCEFV